MDEAHGPRLVHHQKRTDFPAFHDLERLGDERVGRDGFGRFRHDIFNRSTKQIGCHVAAQIAIGDEARQCAIGLCHDHAAQPARRCA